MTTEQKPKISDYKLIVKGRNALKQPNGNIEVIYYFGVQVISDDPELDGADLVEKIGDKNMPIIISSVPIVLQDNSIIKPSGKLHLVH